MDGFKNTTRTSYDTSSGRKFANGGMTVSRNDMADGQGPMSKPAMVAKYAKGGHVKKAEQKIGRVMTEFTKGKLHSGSKEGPKVKSTKQAVAIALNEARAAGAKIPRVKRNQGTPIGKGPERASPEANDVIVARMTKDELAMGAKGIKMARERMARERNRQPGAVVERKTGSYEDVSRRALGSQATAAEQRAVRKSVPPANREPMYGPAKRLSIPLNKGGMACGMNKGGLSVMPKGKGGKC